jgi:hypothetical protein
VFGCLRCECKCALWWVGVEQGRQRKADLASPLYTVVFSAVLARSFGDFIVRYNVQQHPLPSLLDKGIVLGFWGHSFAAPGRQENPDKEGEHFEKTSKASFFEVGLEC